MSRNLDPAAFVRPELRGLAPYHLDLEPCRFKLDQNEMPFDLPLDLKRQIVHRFVTGAWSTYPDFHADALREALARHHGWRADGVLAGNGSNELLGLVLEAVVRPGAEVLVAVPSFGLYRMFVLRAGGEPRALGPEPDGRLPMAAIRAAIEDDPTRPLLICSPNNPTGEALSVEAVAGLLERIEAPLLLDNAYGEFCCHDYRPLLREHRQLVLLRTFSKAWSLAALRLGYLLADPTLVAELIKVKLPYNVDRLSAAAGVVVLENAARLARRVEVVRRRRETWRSALMARGLEVFPSQANFVLVRHPRADELRSAFERAGIRVRDVGGYPALEGCLRIGVGTGGALRRAVEVIDRLLGGSSEEVG